MSSEDAAIKADSQNGAAEKPDDEYDDDEEEYEEDDELFDDADEEAQAVAKQLGDALWADITKAYTQQKSKQLLNPVENGVSSSLLHEGDDDDDEETLVNAIQAVLDLADGHQMLHEALSNAIVPHEEAGNLLDVLTDIVGMKTVSPQLAAALSDQIQSIAGSDTFLSLFPPMKNSHAKLKNPRDHVWRVALSVLRRTILIKMASRREILENYLYLRLEI